MILPFGLKTCNGSHCRKNRVQIKKSVFHEWIGIFRKFPIPGNEPFLKFPAPKDVSFPYDFLLYFGDSKTFISLLFCIAS